MVPFCLLLFMLVLVQGRPQQANNNDSASGVGVIDISYKPMRPSYQSGSISNVAQIIPPGQPWPSNPAGYANFSQTSPPPPQEAINRWSATSTPSSPSDGQTAVPARNDAQPPVPAPAPPSSDEQSLQDNDQSIQNNDQSIQNNDQSIQNNDQSLESNEQTQSSVQQSNDQSLESKGQTTPSDDPQSPPPVLAGSSSSSSNDQAVPSSSSSSQPPSSDQSSPTPSVDPNDLSTSRPQQVDDEPVQAVTEAVAVEQSSSASSVTSEASTEVPAPTTTQKPLPAPSPLPAVPVPLPISDDIPQAPFLSVNIENSKSGLFGNEARSKPVQEPNTFLIPESEPEPISRNLPQPPTPVVPEVNQPEPETKPGVTEINQSQLPYEPPNPEVFRKITPSEENPTINALLPLHPKKPELPVQAPELRPEIPEINQNQPTPPHVPSFIPEITPPTTPRAGRRTNNLGGIVGNEVSDTRFVNRPQGRPFDFAPNGFPEDRENALPAGGNVYRYPLPPPPSQYYPRRHDYPGPFRGHVRYTLRPHLVYPF